MQLSVVNFSSDTTGVYSSEPGDVKIVACVLLEMLLSFLGILLNLLVFATIRHHEKMLQSTTNLLVFNLCFSNILISFLVKPISAIYAGYSLSTGNWHIRLVFCSLFTFLYNTTFCILPFTVISFCWLHILNIIYCWLPCQSASAAPTSSLASFSYSSTLAPLRMMSTDSCSGSYLPGLFTSPSGPASPESKRRLAATRGNLSVSQKVLLLSHWLPAILYGALVCFPEEVNFRFYLLCSVL